MATPCQIHKMLEIVWKSDIMKQVGGIAEVYLEKPGFVTLEYWCTTKNFQFEAVSGAFNNF